MAIGGFGIISMVAATLYLWFRFCWWVSSGEVWGAHLLGSPVWLALVFALSWLVGFVVFA
jgi:hypothetical protein